VRKRALQAAAFPNARVLADGHREDEPPVSQKVSAVMHDVSEMLSDFNEKMAHKKAYAENTSYRTRGLRSSLRKRKGAAAADKRRAVAASTK
jgi:hypothetical protein